MFTSFTSLMPRLKYNISFLSLTKMQSTSQKCNLGSEWPQCEVYVIFWVWVLRVKTIPIYSYYTTVVSHTFIIFSFHIHLQNFCKFLRKFWKLKPATDNLREVCETQKTCVMRHVCMSYFVLFMLLHAIDFLCLKLSRSRSANYAWDKRICFCNKG